MCSTINLPVLRNIKYSLITTANFTIMLLRMFTDDAGFDLEPRDYDSYLLEDGSREVISFECRATQTSTNVRPIITWQWCEDVPNTFTDIVESTETLASGRRSGLLTHYFLQSGYTGYLQILDPENPTYNGADIRCKVSSPIPGDNCTYYSSCAEITTYFSRECVCVYVCGCVCACVYVLVCMCTCTHECVCLCLCVCV